MQDNDAENLVYDEESGEEIRRALYSVIPASVRYDKDICANAKLMYGEITALCNEKGYSWAGNQYFVSLYNTSVKSVSRWIKQLADKGYILVSYIRKNDQTKEQKRRIALCPIVQGYRQKSPDPMDKKVLCPMDKNVPVNIINNKDEYIDICSPAQNSQIPMSTPSEDMPSKATYGKYKNVKLTTTEFTKLSEKENGLAAMEFLSEYIEMKGYKAKSHYLAINKWVFMALAEKTLKDKELASREQRLRGGGKSVANSGKGTEGDTDYGSVFRRRNSDGGES